MRSSTPLWLASLLLSSLVIATPRTASAEDAPDDSSAAGKAYKDAWWEETGGGNLAQAIERYETAATAEGPSSIKARALYRKAIVLQRIGKTEDAIRTLERLAKEHPGETTVQADARARLAEWTAVDLKTSFGEWYRRYQYSPEFQAKIVDLVLKLGGDAASAMSASSEILTIGEPTIPALKQHLNSPNASLKEQVVTALLRLGEIPSMGALRSTHGWKNDQACWLTLHAASPDTRARLRAEAKPDEPWDQGILAALDGPSTFYTWANTPAATQVANVLLVTFGVVRAKDSDAGALRPLRLALIENSGLSEQARNQVVYSLFATRGVDAALAERWARSAGFLQAHGLAFLADPRGDGESGAALRRLVKEAAAWDAGSRALITRGVLARLEEAPVGEELDRLVDELLPVLQGDNLSRPLGAPARAVLARMVDRTPDEATSVRFFRLWQPRSLDEHDFERMLAWIRTTRWSEIRDAAIDLLANAPGDWPKRLAELLGEPDLDPALRLPIVASVLRPAVSAAVLRRPEARRAFLTGLRRRIPDAVGWDWGLRALLTSGVLSALEQVPVGEDLDRLADEMLPIFRRERMSSPAPSASRAVLARMVDRARDADTSLNVFHSWSTRAPSDSDVEQMAAWVSTAPGSTRDAAVSALAAMPGRGPERLVEFLADPKLAPEIRYGIFRIVLDSRGSATLRDGRSRRAILSAMRAFEGTKPQYNVVSMFLGAFAGLAPEGQRAVAMEWIADPEAFPRALLVSQKSNAVTEPWSAAIQSLAPAWRAAWPSWTPAQRDAAVIGLPALVPSDDPELKPFLQAAARDRTSGISSSSREDLLDYVDRLTVDDLRLAFDMSTPAGVDAAVFFLRHADVPNPRPPELFDAVALGVRPEAAKKVALAMLELFAGDERVRRRLIAAVLAHEDEAVELAGLQVLADRESSEDLPLWLAALARPSVRVRSKAAAGLGRITHPDATKALVKALDDPSSAVRDAAIASLQAIQKIEDLKKEWREKVR